MLFLPTLTADAPTQPKLPLSPRAADELWRALCLPSAEKRLTRFSATIAREPAFALWIAQRSAEKTPADIQTLAAWLDQEGLSQLALAEYVERVHIERASPSGEHVRLFTASVMLAKKCRAAFPHDAQAAGQAHVLGLLFLAPRILRNDPTARNSLPAWLTGLANRDSAASAASATSVIATVREIVCDLFGREFLVSSDPPQLTVLKPSLHKKIQRRWQCKRRPAEKALPQLAARLAGLRGLEDNFQNLLEQEKIAAMYALAYGAGHEFNNPLANISSRAQTLLRDETDPERRQKLAMINSQAFRAHEMIANMMLFAKPPALHRADVDLHDVLSTLKQEMEPLAIAQQAALEVQCDEIPQPVFLDQQQLLVGLRALTTNALQAANPAGVVSIRAKFVPAERFADSSLIEIRVADNGPGFDATTRRHLFDPFFSGREAGRGLGFGLCWCWRVVAMHGGSIEVDSQPNEGAEFVLRLPCGQTAD